MLAQMPMLIKVTPDMEQPPPRSSSNNTDRVYQHHPYPHPNQLLRPTSAPQQNEDTANLLHFIDMASSNIKLALDRPSKSKRKVNHRKYLQKQLRRCGDSPSKGDGSSSSSGDGDHGHHGGLSASAAKSYRKEVSQIGLQIKSLQALFDPRTLQHGDRRGKGSSNVGIHSGVHRGIDGVDGGAASTSSSKQVAAAGQKMSLRNRNLPASFFVEPALRACDRPAVDRDIVLSAAVSAGALPPHFSAPAARPAHQHNASMTTGEHVTTVGPNGYSALPSDTLESILGHADLNELLSGQTWYHHNQLHHQQQHQQQQQQQLQQQQQQRHFQDTNPAPQREGSVGTCSPRSISDSSDMICTPSPVPSSSSSTSSSTRSPSWSPGFPVQQQQGGSGGQFPSPPVVVPQHDDLAASECSGPQYFVLGQAPTADGQLQQHHGRGQFEPQQYQMNSHSHFHQHQQQQQEQQLQQSPPPLVQVRGPMGHQQQQHFVSPQQQHLHRHTPPAPCSASPSHLTLAPAYGGDFDTEPSPLYYNSNQQHPQHYPHQQQQPNQQQLPQQQQQQQQQQMPQHQHHELQGEKQDQNTFGNLPSFSQTFSSSSSSSSSSSEVGLQLDYSSTSEEVMDDPPASGWPSIHPHNYSDYLC